MAEPTDEDIVEQDSEKSEPAEEDKKSDDKHEEVVPVRKSVLNAQRRIIEKQQKQIDKSSKSSEKDDDDAELTPKARKLIEEEVERRTAPLQDELAFRDYFATHPEDRKFEKQARARFDAWGSVPIEEVMKTLRPGISAEDREKAEDKAKRASLKGSTQRPKEPTIAKTEADYKKVYENVKRGNRGEALKQLGVTE